MKPTPAVRWLLVAFLVGALLGLWAMRATHEYDQLELDIWRDLERVDPV